jgi:hypothetical protein
MCFPNFLFRQFELFYIVNIKVECLANLIRVSCARALNLAGLDLFHITIAQTLAHCNMSILYALQENTCLSSTRKHRSAAWASSANEN